jgi:hypothetical protein
MMESPHQSLFPLRGNAHTSDILRESEGAARPPALPESTSAHRRQLTLLFQETMPSIGSISTVEQILVRNA